MRFSTIKHIKNREIHEEDIRRIWDFFFKLAHEEKPSVVVGLTVKSEAYGEISGDSDEVINEAMLRRKPIKEVVFRYESKDFRSSMTLCLQDEFSGFLEVGRGGVFELESSDRQWFESTFRRAEDLIESLHKTPLCSRILCRFKWLVSSTLAFGLAFIVMKVLFGGLVNFNGRCPELANRVVLIITSCLIVLFYSIISGFISRNYPVVDLDLFKDRTKTRQICSKFFWWVLGALGAIAISMCLSLGKRDIHKTEMQSMTTNGVRTVSPSPPFERSLQDMK